MEESRRPRSSSRASSSVVPGVRGVAVGPQTRCAHYHSPRDVVAIKFRCCGDYYACHACHEAVAGHPARRWPAERFDARAVRCGVCRAELTIRAYLALPAGAAGHAMVRATRCPQCGAAFNPGCARHHDRYFCV